MKQNGCYETLAEKKDFFTQHPVTSVEQLLDDLQKLGKAYVFRGQSNAYWKIRSSAQRWWQDERCEKCFKKQTFVEFVDAALQFTKDFPLLQPKCGRFNDSEVQFGDHETLGFLQHYGFPTPLIDFSHDFWVALYMAVKGPQKSGTEVSDHFSIYAVRKEPVYGHELYCLESLVRERFGSDYNTNDVTIRFRASLDSKSISFGGVSCILLHKDGTLWCQNLAHERIASQGGLFVYLNDDEEKGKCLEECMVAYRKWDEAERKGEAIQEECPNLNFEPIICWDVPYSFAPAIQELCTLRGYTERSLGLEDKTIASEAQRCFESFVQSIHR